MIWTTSYLLKVGLPIIIMVASCAPKNSLFYYRGNSVNMKGRIKSIDEKNYKAVANDSTVIMGERETLFDTIGDDIKEFYDSLGRIVREIHVTSDDVLRNESTYDYSNKDTVLCYRKYRQDGQLNLYCKKYFKDKYLVTYFLNDMYYLKDRYNRNGMIKLQYVIKKDSQVLGTKFEKKSITRYKKHMINCITYNSDNSFWSIEKKILNCNFDDSLYFISFPKIAKAFNYSYQYEYDSKSNWTKKIKYINGVARSVIIRKIEYY